MHPLTDFAALALDLARDPSLLPSTTPRQLANEQDGPQPMARRSREDDVEPMGEQEWERRKGA